MSTTTVIIGDCRVVIPELIASGVTIGAVVTDPPYGIDHPTDYDNRGRSNLAKSNNYVKVDGDNEPFDPALILSLNVPTVLWGANYYADKLPPSAGWLVWDKDRPDTLDQSTCELAWTNYVKGVRRFRHLWNGMMRASEQGENYHPTQKPVALFRWLMCLSWFPKRPRLVLDPFAGSGPVGVACVQLGYDYIGIDTSESYVNIARKRIEDAQRQTSMFYVDYPVQVPLW